MAPALHPLRGQFQTSHLDGAPEDRHTSTDLVQQTADGVHLVLIDDDTQGFFEVIDVHRRGHAPVVRVDLLDVGILPVVFVDDLADDLLEDVLDRDQPRSAAVFVDDDRNVLLVALHLLEEHIGQLALRHENRRTHRLGHRHLTPCSVRVHPPGHILEIDHADDVVRVLPRHRDARIARPQKQIQPLSHRAIRVDRHHVGARDHHLTGQRVAQLEDPVDHPALLRLDDLTVRGHIDEIAQLRLALEGPIPKALARSHRIAEDDEQP